MPEFRIKFFACQYRRLFKDSMSKQIDCAVAELARQWTKLMAGLPVSIVFTNNVSLDFLNHMQLSSGSHCVFNLKAHLIFVVAYRRKAISSTILERLKEFFRSVPAWSSQTFWNVPGRKITFIFDLLPSNDLSIKFGAQTKNRVIFENSSRILQSDSKDALGQTFLDKKLLCNLSRRRSNNRHYWEIYQKSTAELTFGRPLSIPALAHGEFRGIC